LKLSSLGGSAEAEEAFDDTNMTIMFDYQSVANVCRNLIMCVCTMCKSAFKRINVLIAFLGIMADLKLGTIMERTHKKGFALWTVPNLFLIFNLLPILTVPLVFRSLILFASVPKFRVSLQQLQPPFKIDVLHSYLTWWITRCYLTFWHRSFTFKF
jgi:hypothetical protein